MKASYQKDTGETEPRLASLARQSASWSRRTWFHVRR